MYCPNAKELKKKTDLYMNIKILSDLHIGNSNAAGGGILCFRNTAGSTNQSTKTFIQKQQTMELLLAAGSSTKALLRSIAVIMLFVAGFSAASFGQSKSLNAKGDGRILIEAVSNGHGAYDYSIKSGNKIIAQSNTAQSFEGGYATAESAVAEGEKYAAYYKLTEMTANELTPALVKAMVDAVNYKNQVHNK